MAITWDVNIEVLNIQRREARITAIRTDDTDLENIDIRTYIISGANIATTEQKLAVMDNIWAQYQASLTRETQVAAIVTELEAQAKANLEARK